MPAASIMKLDRLRHEGHCSCLACTHPELKLSFALDGPHRLRTSVYLTDSMLSFNGMVHGGLIALLIDQSMACALMAEGHYGVTGDLSLRYHAPVRPGKTADIIVSVDSKFGDLFKLTAELRQDDVYCTRATAKFMRQELQAS